MEELMDEAKTTLSDKSLKVPLKSLNLKKAVVVAVGTSLKKCIEKMLARHFGCLLVVKDTKYCGIFTERDVLLRVCLLYTSSSPRDRTRLRMPSSACKKKSNSFVIVRLAKACSAFVFKIWPICLSL